MTPQRAILSRPSGFSDVEDRKSEVAIVGYVWGKSQDVGRYSDNRAECAMAIVVDAQGRMSSIPIANLTMLFQEPK